VHVLVVPSWYPTSEAPLDGQSAAVAVVLSMVGCFAVVVLPRSLIVTAVTLYR